MYSRVGVFDKTERATLGSLAYSQKDVFDAASFSELHSLLPLLTKLSCVAVDQGNKKETLILLHCTNFALLSTPYNIDFFSESLLRAERHVDHRTDKLSHTY